MNSPIYNPNVPYVGIVPGGVLQPGALIRIQGTAHVGARCFAVNLQCGPSTSPRDDVALHLSPVFSPPPRVVRNSIQQHQWGPEESHGPPFPFVAGQGFEMLVLAEQNRYKIAINGAHYTEFNHRMPLHRVTHISIDGDVSIIMLAFEGTAASSAPPMPAASVASMAGASLPPYPISGGDMAMPSPMSMPVPDSGRTSPYGGAPPMPPVGPQYGVAPAPYPQQPGYGAGYPHGPPPGTYPGGYPAASYPGPGVQYVSHGHKSHKSSPIPISGNLGKGLAVGAGALAGAALLKHANPLKAKKMKKMFKHKHKHGWGGWSSSSSSSSSEEE